MGGGLWVWFKVHIVYLHCPTLAGHVHSYLVFQVFYKAGFNEDISEWDVSSADTMDMSKWMVPAKCAVHRGVRWWIKMEAV
jgi:hypothetical protein